MGSKLPKTQVVRIDINTSLQCIMFFGLQVDRGNLTEALADNMLKDLHLNTNGTSLPSG